MSKPLTFEDVEALVEWGRDACVRVLVEDPYGDIWHLGSDMPDKQKAWDIVSTCQEGTHWRLKREDGAVFALHFRRDYLGRPVLCRVYGPDKVVGDCLIETLNWW